MNKKDYEECLDRLDKYVFGRDMAVKEDWYDLLNYHKAQLQAYKEKEYNLRDKLEKSLDSYDPIENKDDLIRYWCVTDILQILNEGDK